MGLIEQGYYIVGIDRLYISLFLSLESRPLYLYTHNSIPLTPTVLNKLIFSSKIEKDLEKEYEKMMQQFGKVD